MYWYYIAIVSIAIYWYIVPALVPNSAYDSTSLGRRLPYFDKYSSYAELVQLQ